MEAVLAEAEELAGQGVREITYVAQDTTRFQLSELIHRTCSLGGVEWVRSLYCYPSRVDHELLETLVSEEKACPYLDIPMQHIDPNVLKAMNRQGTPDQLYDLVNRARDMGLTLRTTFLVGFPGEDEAAFLRLCDFVEDVQFDRMGVFMYSPEEDTPAMELLDQVPKQEKRRRLDHLMRLQQRISLHRNQERLDSTVTVLCEGADWGRSAREAPEIDGVIRFTSETPVLPGEFVSVYITRALPYDLEGVRV